MSIREGLWDCASCGNKGILGRYRACPACNKPRADDVQFYLPLDAREITSFVQISDAGAGADWYCTHCGSGNAATATHCKRCGADRDNASQHKTTTYTPENIPHSAQETEVKPPHVPPKKSKKGKIIIGGLTLSTGLGVYFSLTPSHIPVTVSGFAWERSVVVEEYKTLHKTAWEIPEGGRIVSKARALHHYESILDHYEQRSRQVCENVQTGVSTYNCGSRDLGNGYFQDQTCSKPEYRQVCHNESYREPVYRQEPRYATKYTFDVEEWVPVSQPTIHRQDHAPLWPKVKLGDKQRTVNPEEKYSVDLQDKNGKSYTYSPNFDLWKSLKTGQRFTATVTFDDEVLELAPTDHQ